MLQVAPSSGTSRLTYFDVGRVVVQHAHLRAIFSLVKQPLISLKIFLSSETCGVPSEIERKFRYLNLLTLWEGGGEE